MTRHVRTQEELLEMASTLLRLSHDYIAYYSPAVERFYYILECQRVIREMSELLDRS